MPSMRLLIYSQDGMGLGHLRRTRNIAQQVLALEPDCQVLALVDAPDAPFFPRLRGMDFVKLPTIVKTGNAGWRSESSQVVEDVVATRSRLMLEAFRGFAPDAVLIDHMPVGARGELRPMLDEESDAKFFLSLRDVLDAPEVVRDVWTDVGAYDYLPRYDTVLVHGCEEIFDADAAYGLRARAQSMVYNHYVAPPTNGNVAHDANAEPLVLVTGGGGADAFPLAETFLRALPLALESTPLRALVLTGPNMPAAQREQLAAMAAPYPVEVRESSEDATALLRQASAVVTMGGYNTLCEVLASRKPALVVPRAGPSAEQRIRSRIFADRNLVRMLEPDGLTPEALAHGLLDLLAADDLPDEASIPPLDGAARAAALMLERLGADESVAAGSAT